MASEIPLYKRGMILGKFMPPTNGHLHLAHFAEACCERLSVLVCSTPHEPLPGACRFQWMKELLPNCDLVHIADDLPAAPEDADNFWELWLPAIHAAVGEKIDVVFTSEDYGEELASRLDAKHMIVDQARTSVNVSGSSVRADPMGNWEDLPPAVKPWYCRRVVVFGPESTGKTTLAQDLAAHYKSVWVPEYARAYLDPKGGQCDFEDLHAIALGQAASEDSLARVANRVLIADTDTLTTTIWSEVYFDRVEPWIAEMAKQREHDLYLLCDIDVPWVDDSQRNLDHRRQEFFDRCERALVEHGRRYQRISGDWQTRFGRATKAIDEMLRTPQTEWPPAAQTRLEAEANAE